MHRLWAARALRCISIVAWAAAQDAAAATLPLPEADAHWGPAAIRQRQPFFVATEVGWNGLAGLGLNVGYHPHPRLALELAGGGGTSGARLGARARWHLLSHNLSPFLGLGGVYNFGVTGLLYRENRSPELSGGAAETVTNPLAGFGLQGTAGLCWARDNGLMLIFAAGFLWAPPSPQLIPPSPSVDISFSSRGSFMTGSGPVVTVAVGQSF